MKKYNTQTNTKWLIFIILFSCVLVLASIFFTIKVFNASFSLSTQKGNGFSIKNIHTYISSPDGKSHNLAADFYITYSKKNITEAQLKEIQTTLLQIIPTLDYEKLNQKGGTNYFIQSVENELKSNPSTQWIDEVYISNLLLDIGISDTKNDKHKNVIKEMFDND